MRELQNWMKTYRDYVQGQESPSIFHFWISMQLISAALKRNVWIDRGAYTVYPNQYVILVARSGTCRKSVAMENGLDLLTDVEGVKMLHERMTVEGLMDELQMVSILPNGRVVPDGSILIHADELANLFGKAAYITDLMTFVTAAYTSKAKLDFLTRSKGLRSVRNPCITLLSGTTPEQLSEIFPSMSLVSGLLGRILLVVGDYGSRVTKPRLQKSLKKSLVKDLTQMSKLYGEMKLTDEAEDAFDAWYQKLPQLPPAELDAFYQRKHDHVLKAALLLSAAESDELIITKSHLASARKAIDYAESKMSDVLAFIGATAQSTVSDLIMNILKAKEGEPVSHSTILRKVYRRVQNKNEFRDIIDTLIESNRIIVSASERGMFYQIKPTKKRKKYVSKLSGDTNPKKDEGQ